MEYFMFDRNLKLYKNFFGTLTCHLFYSKYSSLPVISRKKKHSHYIIFASYKKNIFFILKEKNVRL